MNRIHRPCLATVPLLGSGGEPGLADILPENCFVQEIVIECCRMSRQDPPVPGAHSDYFTLKRSAPGLYINRQHILLSTPVEKPAGGHEWSKFVDVIRQSNEIAASMGDYPITPRTYIKGCTIVELPADVYHANPQPQKAAYDPWEPDPLYEGVRFAAVHIEGSMFIAMEDEMKDGYMPGLTHSFLDIDLLSMCITKPTGRDMAGAASWKAFSRKPGDITRIKEDTLINIPDEDLHSLIPTLCDCGIVKMREEEIEEYSLTRGRALDVGIRPVRPA